MLLCLNQEKWATEGSFCTVEYFAVQFFEHPLCDDGKLCTWQIEYSCWKNDLLTLTTWCRARLRGSTHHKPHHSLASWEPPVPQSWLCNMESSGARYLLAIVWRIRNQWCAAWMGRRRHRHTKCWLASNPDEQPKKIWQLWSWHTGLIHYLPRWDANTWRQRW